MSPFTFSASNRKGNPWTTKNVPRSYCLKVLVFYVILRIQWHLFQINSICCLNNVFGFFFFFFFLHFRATLTAYGASQDRGWIWRSCSHQPAPHWLLIVNDPLMSLVLPFLIYHLQNLSFVYLMPQTVINWSQKSCFILVVPLFMLKRILCNQKVSKIISWSNHLWLINILIWRKDKFIHSLNQKLWSSHDGAAVMNPTRNHEVVGSILALTQ